MSKVSSIARVGALSLPVLERGWVWLVGAGPGDPGLLTLHAANALAQADVVVYDALVDEEILKLLRPGAEIAYAGIPATHRDVNHAVTFVTGHMAGGDVPDTIDWRALGAGSPVIVIYMGLKHLPRIVGELVAAGRAATEPVAVISNATTAKQRVLETTLATAVADVAANAIEAPALIVVGDVVRLRAGLDWLSALNGVKLDADPLRLKRMRDAG
jgi:siroheme synthase